MSLAALGERWHSLTGVTGWNAALARASVGEELLVQALHEAAVAPGTQLQLLLRGSGAQGVLSIHSDLDFEVSDLRHPHGDDVVEQAVIHVLEGMGIDAEGSRGRPREVDVTSPRGLTRDLNELMELRVAGSPSRNQGWVAREFGDTDPNWTAGRSTYERHGQHRHAKFVFFEARTLVARLAWRHDCPVGTTPTQLAWLPMHLGVPAVSELSDLVKRSLRAYEDDPRSTTGDTEVVQQELQRFRQEHGVVGPDPARNPPFDLRRPPPGPSI